MVGVDLLVPHFDRGCGAGEAATGRGTGKVHIFSQTAVAHIGTTRHVKRLLWVYLQTKENRMSI
jgi:hypothetical protein